ncbi:endonuclease/exonuclease/phosphatase family protein [Sulfurimonas sp.]
MLKAKTSPRQFIHKTKKLSCKFSLLLWNIHKENQTKAFAKKFQEITDKYPADIFLIQEVKYPKNELFYFHEHSYALAANIETKKDIYGVFTATKFSFEHLKSLLSTKRELGFMTHKSMLITKHLLCKKQTLHIINLHAINFVTFSSFAYELQKIKERVSTIEGALIVAGDFNTWSKKRQNLLKNFQEELSLKKLTIDEPKNVKQIFTKEIDHIYYRGVKALYGVAIDTKNVSDHNPIYANFELVI